MWWNKPKDRTGKRYGHLMAVSISEGSNKPTKWLCRCDCGKFKIATVTSLQSGHTKSCGCKRFGQKKPKQVELKYCENCNSLLSRKRSLENGKFCNIECYGQYLSKYRSGVNHPNWHAVTLSCKTCGKLFQRSASGVNDNPFCTRRCYWKWLSENWAIHPERSPNWKGGIMNEPYCQLWSDREYKQDLLERDNRRCLNPICEGKSNRLVLHHIDYDKKNCSPENLATLCNACNTAANHNREWYSAWYSRIIKKRYPTRMGIT